MLFLVLILHLPTHYSSHLLLQVVTKKTSQVKTLLTNYSEMVNTEQCEVVTEYMKVGTLCM